MNGRWAAELARARAAGLRVVDGAVRRPVVAVQGGGVLSLGPDLSADCRCAILTAALARHRGDPEVADVCVAEGAAVCWMLHGEAACLRVPVFQVA